MKQNLRRAAVYGVAGLATAALGASAANALIDDKPDATAAPVPAPAPASAPVHLGPVAAPQPQKVSPPHTANAPAQPHRVAPAAAHRPAVAKARPKLPKAAVAKQVKVARTQQAPAQRAVDAAAKPYIVLAAAKPAAPAAKPVAPLPEPRELTDAVKAVSDAHEAVKKAEKTVHEAKDKLKTARENLHKVRDNLKKRCEEEKLAAKKIKHIKRDDDLKILPALPGRVIVKTATASGGGAHSTSIAKAVNGTVTVSVDAR